MLEVTGTSVAILENDSVAVVLRDDKPELKYSNQLDFPGGERLGNEDPTDCGIRESLEEVGLCFEAQDIIWQRDYPFLFREGAARFLVVRLALDTPRLIKLGDEGQSAQFMLIEEFLSRKDVVSAQQERLCDYLGSVSALGAVA